MQRTYVAIAFALAMTCAFAAVTPSNYVKPPVQVVPDADTNFTNNTGSSLLLASVTAGNLYVVSQKNGGITPNTSTNTSSYAWSAWFKKLNVKDFSATENTTLTWIQPLAVTYSNGYAISLIAEEDANVTNIRVYQQPITGGAALGRLTLTTNNDTSFKPSSLGQVGIGKVVYVFYLAADKKVNCTSFTIGGTVGTKEFTLTTSYESGFQAIWGEALSSSQAFVAWIEGGAFKDTVVDLSKGTSTPVAVGGWSNTSACILYTTDKKYYGELCIASDGKSSNYSIRTNTTSLVNLVSNVTRGFLGIYPYGPYLAIFYQDSTTTAGTTAYSYDIWNLDTLAAFKNNTQFLTNDGKSAVRFGRVNAGGIYTLTYTLPEGNVTTFTGISVGLVLGSSYLTTIAGFLFAIIAGLFLF